MPALESILDCTLSSLYARSRLLYTHSHETAQIAVQLGRVLELGEDELLLLRVAGVMHDVGKLAILPEILFKPGELTRFERELVYAHPEQGVKHIKRVPYLVDRFGADLLMMVMRHHEEPDGTGYPRKKGVKDLDIPTRILIIADRFQAMTNDRSYRKAYDPEMVVDQLINYLIDAFFPHDRAEISEYLKNSVKVDVFPEFSCE